MTLLQAIIYYIFAFLLTLAFIICGCLIGSTLRKRKNAKLAAESLASSKDSINIDSTEEK